MTFDLSSSLTYLHRILSEGTKKQGWIAVCKTGPRFYFVDATNLGLTTCVTDNIIFDDYESAKASLEREGVSDTLCCQIAA